MDEDGRRLQESWGYVDSTNGAGKEFEEGWHYFGPDGKGYHRTGNSFKRSIEDATYIFDENGKMLAGWFDEEGTLIDDSDASFVEGVYYAGADGRLLTEEWLEYGSVDEHVGGDDLESEISGLNYRDYEKMWLYFDNHLKKVESKGEALRQKTIDGAKYGFDENGIMIPWWSQVGTVSNANKSNPTSDVSARYYSGYDGGELLADGWN